jgi:hypothetical protein
MSVNSDGNEKHDRAFRLGRIDGIDVPILDPEPLAKIRIEFAFGGTATPHEVLFYIEGFETARALGPSPGSVEAQRMVAGFDQEFGLQPRRPKLRLIQGGKA